jgi:hypothetical protein
MMWLLFHLQNIRSFGLLFSFLLPILYLRFENEFEMNTQDEYRFLRLDLAGLQTLVEWAAGEGWNPGLADAELFYTTDPEGFYGYFNGDEMMGGGSLVSYGGHYGFMGFFIIKPEYRSVGLGKTLWFLRRNLLQKRLHPDAPIGMDGVVAMQPFYARGGFRMAFRDERHERMGEAFSFDSAVRRICPDDYDSLIRYDTRCFGFPRPDFLRPWLCQPASYAFVYGSSDSPEGYAVLRKARIGYKIGPLFAENAAVAEQLYRACLASVPGEWVYLDIPAANQAAVDLVRKYDTRFVFECARMYYGNPPETDIHCVYGITSFELG